MAEHFQTGVNLTKARAGYMFLPSSAKDFVPDGVVLRTPLPGVIGRSIGFVIGENEKREARRRTAAAESYHAKLKCVSK